MRNVCINWLETRFHAQGEDGRPKKKFELSNKSRARLQINKERSTVVLLVENVLLKIVVYSC